MPPPPSRFGPARALTTVLTLTLGLAGLAPASPAGAQGPTGGGDGAALEITGYVRTFTGVYQSAFAVPDPSAPAAAASTAGFHGQVARVKWGLEGEDWRLDLHNRLQARVATAGAQGPVVGIGVSAVPDRLVDLETDLVSEPGLRVWHEVDRLSLTLFTGPADVTIGRQAITWGISGIFPVADLWARFSPFELDTEEKPGVDAVRALSYPADGLELDAVVADRGAIEDLSMGVRGTYTLPSAEVWGGAGKFWREAMVMGGITVLLEQARLRAEAVLPWNLDVGRMEDPRATLGVDWIRGTLTVTGEYHFNGIGAADTGDYTAVLLDPRFLRGETYHLGRHYLGGLLSWSPDDASRLTLALNGQANLHDGSMALTPVFGYDLGQAARVSLGGLLSFGDTPRLTTVPPTLRSEFGTYGRLLFTGLSIFF